MSKLVGMSDQLNRLVTGFCALLLLVMLGISFVGALYQAITGDALSWTYSLARQFVPWIGLLSITVAFKSGAHISMAILVNMAPARTRAVIEWIVVLSIAVFALTLLVLGLQFAIASNQSVMISDQIQISQRWVAASLPVTGLVLVLHLVSGRALLDGLPDIPDIIDGIDLEDDHPTPSGGR